MGWNYPLTFDSKEPFCPCVVFPLTLTQFLPLFILAMIIPLRCLQETRTGHLPCFVATSISESKQGADYEFLYWSPPVAGNAKRRLADLQFPNLEPIYLLPHPQLLRFSSIFRTVSSLT